MSDFKFVTNCEPVNSKIRAGVIHTPHGNINTPAFIPVGTQATVKSITPDDLSEIGVPMFFVNTYHTYLRPGIGVIKKFDGLHRFMGWDRPIITDSGGFQVFSLDNRKYGKTSDQETLIISKTEDGVKFRSHWDGSEHLFTPENSMEYQWQLGSDIHIAFDDCTPYPVNHTMAAKSMDLTHQWALRSLKKNQELIRRLADKNQALNKPYQALYGSIQGSVYKNLRIKSAKFISGLPFDGYAIGGVAVGESKNEMYQVLDWVIPELPGNKPRHLLGVGEIDDIFEIIERGVDTFDCVGPTRLARMGQLFAKSNINPSTSLRTGSQNLRFTIDITKSEFASNKNPIDKDCDCYACLHFSKAYIHHLFHVRELLGYRLATIHNVRFVTRLVADIRNAISQNRFLDLKNEWLYNG